MTRPSAPRTPRSIAKRAFGLAGLAVLLAGMVPTFANEPVQTRAAFIDGGARLVFDWRAPVDYVTTVSGTRLTVSFDRPLAATFDNVLRTLSEHIVDIRIAEGGQSVVFTLVEPRHVTAFAHDNLVVVDLVSVASQAAVSDVAEDAMPVMSAPSSGNSEDLATLAPAAGIPPPPAPAVAAVAQGPVSVEPPDRQQPATEQTAAPQQAAPPTPVMVDGVLSVRYGLHDTYDRIVFDWPERVPYVVSNDQGLIVIQFDEIATVDAGRLASRLPARLRLVEVDERDGGLRVTLAAPPGVRVRDFYNYSKTVIDVYLDPSGASPIAVQAAPPDTALVEADATTEPAATPPPSAETSDSATAAAVDQPETDLASARITADEPIAAPPPPALPPAARAGPPDAIEPTDIAANQPDESADEPIMIAAADVAVGEDPSPGEHPSQQGGSTDLAAAELPATRGVRPTDEHSTSGHDDAAARDQGDEQAPDHDVTGTEQTSEPHSEAPVADPVPEDDIEDTPAAEDVAAIDQSAEPAHVEAAVIGGESEAVMRLRWSQPVAAAVVKRGGRVWVSFDHPDDSFDLAVVQAEAGTIFDDPAIAEVAGALVFSVRVPDNIEPRVSAAGDTWFIQLRPRRSEIAEDLVAERFEDPLLGPGIAFAVDGPGAPLIVADPEVGDQLILVPIAAPGVGLRSTASFVQFSALASAQGLAFDRLSDDVLVRRDDDRVEVVASGGLALSDDQAWTSHGVEPAPEHAAADPSNADPSGAEHDVAAEVAVPHGAGAPRGGVAGDFRLFDQQTWRRLDEGRFAAVNRQLQIATAAAGSETERADARADFARFLFGHGQYRDAGAILRLIGSETPQRFVVDPSLLALRGATALMTGDPGQAIVDLSDIRLSPSGEAQHWRAAALSALGRHNQAEALYATAIPAPAWYDDGLRVPLVVASVDTALDSGNLERAVAELDRLPYFGLAPDLAAEVARRRGLALWRSGDRHGAEEQWVAAIESGFPITSALTVIERARTRYDAGSMNAADAAAALVAVRSNVRRSPHEMGLLRQIADYQFAAGDYRAGLGALRHAATTLSDHPEIGAIDDQMRAILASLFGPEPPVNISPVTAIAMFSEFEDLVPTGAEGAAMLRRLAGRLIEIDLYAPAAGVLASLLDDDLLGEARAELGRDLAVLNLADGQPARAIQALFDSRARGIPESLLDERRWLRASAHLALDDPMGALDALDGDDSDNAAMLRADIFWRAEDWPAAATAFGRLVEGAEFAWPPQSLTTPMVAAMAPPSPPAVALEEAEEEAEIAVAGSINQAMADRGSPLEDARSALPSAAEAAAMDAPMIDELAAELPEAAPVFAARAAALEDVAAEQVLNWAMALTYAEDDLGLSYLRQRYSDVMNETGYGPMFRLLVAEDIAPIESVADLGRVDPSIDMFEQFLAGYRDRVLDDLTQGLDNTDDAMGAEMTDEPTVESAMPSEPESAPVAEG